MTDPPQSLDTKLRREHPLILPEISVASELLALCGCESVVRMDIRLRSGENIDACSFLGIKQREDGETALLVLRGTEESDPSEIRAKDIERVKGVTVVDLCD